MLKNMNYNLLEEIVQLSQSVYRYDRYLQDAHAESGGCTECSQVWERMKQRHEEDLDTLLKQLKHHIDEGMFEF